MWAMSCDVIPVCQTNIKYCFHINYPFTKHQKTSKFMGCAVVPLIFKTSKYIKQKKKRTLFIFLFVNICRYLANAGDLPKIPRH